MSDRTAGGTAFDIAGTGVPLVLIHGVGLDRHLWDPLRPALAERFRVITPDLLGHGDSAALPANPDLRTYAAQIGELLDTLGVADAMVVGFSLGGLVTLACAAWHGARVRRAVVLNAVFDRAPAEREAVMRRVAAVAAHGIASTIDAAIERWFSPAWRAHHPDQEQALRTRMLANRPAEYAKAYRVFATGDRDLVDAVAGIACPLLAATGAEDRNSTPAMSAAIAARVPGAQVHIVPGLRHMGLWEAPSVFTDLISGFCQPDAAAAKNPSR